MIHLTKSSTSNIILTLTEKQTLTAPNYLFWFKSRGTNQEVKFVVLNNADVSPHKERYNEFNITTNTYFGSSPEGDWEYKIYEQTSTTNVNPALATSLLEVGIMRLKDLGNLLEVNIFNDDLNAEVSSALEVSDEEYSGYLSNNPDNTVIVPELPDNSFISNSTNNEIIVPELPDNNFISNDTDNTFITI
jgi:hypothetical protein